MEVTQKMLDTLVFTTTALSYHCPFCKRLIVPSFTLEGDDIKTYIKKEFVKDDLIKLDCCEECYQRFNKKN